MKGSVYKRCKCPVERDAKGRRKACKKAHGSWVFVADLGIDPATGKRRQVRKSGFRTSDDAREELNKHLNAVATGRSPTMIGSPSPTTSVSGSRQRRSLASARPPCAPTASTSTAT